MATVGGDDATAQVDESARYAIVGSQAGMSGPRALGQGQTDPLSVTFAALADPTRRAILARLAAGEATVSELAAPFRLSLPAVSKHLKVLQNAGLVEQSRQAQWRPCRLRPQPLREVAEWMAQYREFLGESYQRLEEYLRELRDGAAGQAGEGDPYPSGKDVTEPD